MAIPVPHLSETDKIGPLRKYLKKSHHAPFMIQKITTITLGRKFQRITVLALEVCKFTTLVLIKNLLLLNQTTTGSNTIWPIENQSPTPLINLTRPATPKPGQQSQINKTPKSHSRPPKTLVTQICYYSRNPKFTVPPNYPTWVTIT